MVTTPQAPPEQKKSAKIPSMNPWLAPNVLCPNPKCHKILAPVVAHEAKGGEPILAYPCNDCGYAFKASLIRGNGECVPLDKIAWPNPLEEGLLGHAK